MKNSFVKNGLKTLALAAAVVFSMAENAGACAMCVGAKTDSRLAQGMNWGIFSLLFVVVCVLGGVASIGIFFARKAASFEAGRETVTAPEMMPAPAKG